MMGHAQLCTEIVGDYRGPRPCVCDVIHQARAADQRLVRDAMTEYMRRLAVAEKPSTDDYVNLINQAGSEPDAAKRRQLYVALNDLFLDESFSMILVEFRPQLLTRSNVNDVGHTLHEAFSYTNTWLS